MNLQLVESILSIVFRVDTIGNNLRTSFLTEKMVPHRRWQAWPAATEGKAVMWREAEVCKVRMHSQKRSRGAMWGLGVFV